MRETPDLSNKTAVEDGQNKKVENYRADVLEVTSFLQKFIQMSQGGESDMELEDDFLEEKLSQSIDGDFSFIHIQLAELDELQLGEDDLTLDDIGFSNTQFSELQKEVYTVLVNTEIAKCESTLNANFQTGTESYDLALYVTRGDIDVETLDLSQQLKNKVTEVIVTAEEVAKENVAHYAQVPSAAATRSGMVKWAAVEKLIAISGLTADELGVTEEELTTVRTRARGFLPG